MSLGYVTTVSSSEQLVSTSTLLVISFLLFLGIILYHIHLKVKQKADFTKYCKKYKKMLRAKILSKNASTADECFVSVHSDSRDLQQNDQYRETLLESNFHVFIDDN